MWRYLEVYAIFCTEYVFADNFMLVRHYLFIHLKWPGDTVFMTDEKGAMKKY